MKTRTYSRFAALLSLNAFALLYPLLNTLSEGPEFFVAHQASGKQIIFLVLATAMLLPLIFGFLELILAVASQKWSWRAHLFNVAIFVTLIVLVNYRPEGATQGVVAICLAVFIGILFSIFYSKIQFVQTLIVFLLPALFIFSFQFFFSHSVRELIKADSVSVMNEKSQRSKPIPIVMIVFDEFSLSTLLTQNAEIDARRFPNFYKLAQTSYWFRNASAVTQFTSFAVPSILTGMRPKNANALPSYHSYPENLFTLLSSSHKIKVFEPFSQLCPELICPSATKKKNPTTELLISDVMAVLLNILLPKDLELGQPDLTGKWSHYWLDGKESWDRRPIKRVTRAKDFRVFLNSLEAQEEASLHFLHILLPHTPYEFNENVTNYREEAKIAYIGDEWKKYPDNITRNYQQYLIQVGAVDSLLGELFDKLKAINLFDDALIVVTADHGVVFEGGRHRRGYVKDKTFYENIMSVPLFFKLPNQTKGIIDDSNIESIDILPSIADTLGIELPWESDGVSAFKSPRNKPEQKLFSVLNNRGGKKANGNEFFQESGSNNEVINLGFSSPKSYPPSSIDWKYALPGFAQNVEEDRFYVGYFPELVGQEISGFKSFKLNEVVSYTLEEKGNRDVGESRVFYNPKSSYCPCRLFGRVNLTYDPNLYLGLALNGKIRSVGKILNGKNGERDYFSFIIPEEHFVPGINDVKLFLLRKDPAMAISVLPVS
jgi:Sulfatase